MNNVALLLKLLFISCVSLSYTNSHAICGQFQQNSQPQTFILAASANTDGLKHTGKDADKMVKALTRHFPNAKKCVLKNANQSDFDLALKRLSKFAQSKDTVFIFFSGHGKQLLEKEGSNKDEKDCCDEALVFNSGELNDDDFVKKVNNLKSKVYIILDTCYAAGAQRADQACPAKSKRIKAASSLQCTKCATSGISHTLKGVLFAATSEELEAYEFGDGGIFSNTFAKQLNQLKSKGGINAVETAFKQVKSEMVKKTKGKRCEQIPERLPR